MVYTIEAAKKSSLISEILITTNDEKVKEIAQKYGITLIDRPENLCNDDTPMLPVLQHALKGKVCDIVVLLQPTSPLRTTADIDNCIKKIKNFNAVYSITENKESPLWSFVIKKEILRPLIPFDSSKTLRQQSEKSYYLNGAVYVFKKEIVMTAKEFILDNVSYVIMPSERAIEIDREYDCMVAEALLNETRK